MINYANLNWIRNWYDYSVIGRASHELLYEERTFPCTRTISEAMRQKCTRRLRTDYKLYVCTCACVSVLIVVHVCGSRIKFLKNIQRRNNFFRRVFTVKSLLKSYLCQKVDFCYRGYWFSHLRIGRTKQSHFFRRSVNLMKERFQCYWVTSLKWERQNVTKLHLIASSIKDIKINGKYALSLFINCFGFYPGQFRNEGITINMRKLLLFQCPNMVGSVGVKSVSLG